MARFYKTFSIKITYLYIRHRLQLFLLVIIVKLKYNKNRLSNLNHATILQNNMDIAQYTTIVKGSSSLSFSR